jgi:hypothetical protein
LGLVIHRDVVDFDLGHRDPPALTPLFR